MIDISHYNIEELASMALKKPEDFGYWGPEDMFKTWGFSGIDDTSQSILEKSNFEVISKDLMERFPGDFRIETYKHWVVGSIDRLVCRILLSEGDVTESNISPSFIAAMEWQERLMDYSVADEHDYLNKEYESVIESIKELPSYLLDLIDTSDSNWADFIYNELAINMNLEIVPDAGLYPKDEDILMAVYNIQYWNKENIEGWTEFIERNNLEPIPTRQYNPNQLNLFED